jgi:glutamine amidotransferase
MTVIVIDNGMGNTGSLQCSLEKVGAYVELSDDAEELLQAERLVLPGVGSFRDGMTHLRDRGLVDVIHQAVDGGTPLLGVCLGMQLLADYGEEGGGDEGLGLIPGRVVRMEPTEGERIPHIGWNEVNPRQNSSLIAGIPAGTDFYFVHSYHFVVEDPDNILLTTLYCGQVVSAVARGKVFGVQFHPEKSSQAGWALIENFLAD